MLFKRTSALTLAAFALMFAFAAKAEAEYKLKGVIFGDSYSDTGNGCIIATNENTDPELQARGDFCKPDGPLSSFYFENQLSNGPVWPKLLTGFDPRVSEPALADGSFIPEFGAPYLKSSGNFNFAVAGSTAQEGLLQVSTFLDFQKMTPLLDFDSFSLLWLGGNSIINALRDNQNAIGRALTVTFAAQSVLSIANQVKSETKTIALVKLPDSGLPPLFDVDPNLIGDALLAKQMTQTLNSLVQTGINSGAFRGNHIIWIDIDNLIETIRHLDGIQVKSAVHGSDTLPVPNDFDGFCVNPNDLPPPEGCADGKAFWDPLHPTETTHALFANCIQATLKGKPVYGYDFRTRTVGACGIPPVFRWFLFR